MEIDTKISYLVKTVSVSYRAFDFIPSTSISYTTHGISYQVAKFYTPRNRFQTYLIFHSSHCHPHCMYIYLQLKELVIFLEAPYD
jgi:hypothetical protein